MALARLSRSKAERERLDLWLKGPVYYGRTLQLCAGDTNGGTNFALLMEGEQRPCILGRRSAETVMF